LCVCSGRRIKWWVGIVRCVCQSNSQGTKENRPYVTFLFFLTVQEVKCIADGLSVHPSIFCRTAVALKTVRAVRKLTLQFIVPVLPILTTKLAT
jgi:hypothetical protein